jgi:putative peptidoglycan lipid II flippase
MLPAMFGVSVSQINLLLDTLLASFLVTGSISWLYYSDRLVEFPLGLIGIALATVILPSLSKQHAEASEQHFSNTLDWGLRWVFIVGTPAAIGLIFLAEPLLITLFQYGEFSAGDAHQASLSLMAYGTGLLPFILIKVLAPGYYARQDTKTPVKIGIIAMVSNMVFNVILMLQFAHIGLAMATALSAALNASLLFIGLKRRGVYKANAGWLSFALKIVIANSLLIIALSSFSPPTDEWLNWTVWERVIGLSALIFGAVIVYFLAIAVTGIKIKQLIKPSTHSN